MPDVSPRTPSVSLADPVVAGPSDAPVHHVRAALDLRLRALLHHEPGTRTGADIEDLHQMRVAVRRMRAGLKAALPLLDATWADGLRTELGWLGGALGPVRDLDVMLLRLRGEIDALPQAEQPAGHTLVAALGDEHATARATLVGALDSQRFRALVERLADAVRLPLPTPSATQDQPELADLVRGEARRLRKAVARAGRDPEDAVLHELRIRGKRVRYTGELVAPALRGTGTGRAVKKLLTATEELQEVLGDHQDACVAELRIRQLLDGLGETPAAEVVFVGGRLVERERTRAEYQRSLWWSAWERVDAHIGEL